MSDRTSSGGTVSVTTEGMWEGSDSQEIKDLRDGK